MNLRKGLTLLSIGVLCNSCSNEKNLESRIIKFSKSNQCELKECAFRMTDVTWFSWDTMRLYQDEIGLHCDFKNNGNLVYSYQKDVSYSGDQTLEFGFGDQQLNSFYTNKNCDFKLVVQYRSNSDSKVYFIMPNESKESNTSFMQ